MRTGLRYLLFTLVAVGAVIAVNSVDKTMINKALGRYRAYDPKAKGSEQIAAAVATAKREHKRVLVQFGGNWCVFCEALDKLVEKTPTLRALHERYVSVHVDAGNNPELNDVYGKAYDLGFPVLIVLDDNGALLHTQASTAFQLPDAVGHDPARVEAFLAGWADPAKPSTSTPTPTPTTAAP